MEWLIQQQEDLVEVNVGDGEIKDFARAAGLEHPETEELLVAIRAYHEQRGPAADFRNKAFRKGEQEEAKAGPVQSARDQPSRSMMGSIDGAQVAELVHMLASTNLQNERLRTAQLPNMMEVKLATLLVEQLPYAWQQSLIMSLVPHHVPARLLRNRQGMVQPHCGEGSVASHP